MKNSRRYNGPVDVVFRCSTDSDEYENGYRGSFGVEDVQAYLPEMDREEEGISIYGKLSYDLRARLEEELTQLKNNGALDKASERMSG